MSRNVKIRIYETIILPVVLYGCETWSLTLSEEHRLRVFVNRVLRRIFESKWDKVMEGWRKRHNKDLHSLYSSPGIITRRTHKISSVCKYCHCNAAVTMVHKHAEFVGPFGRHGCNLQIIEPRLRIILCVYNVQENREAHHM
jgi:hypothetical protein